jgi:integral membrane protein (TIGR01906 family)
LLRLTLTVAVFFLLLAVSARLVMTPLFLRLEYTRPGFPADSYGFSADDRLRYAPYALDYLIYNADMAFLTDLTDADGLPLFNDRELQHMADVQRLTAAVFTAAIIIGSLTVIASLIMWRAGHSALLRRAFRDAGLLTLGVIGLIVVFAITSWNAFFTGFHTTLFAEGSWYFAYSDTLIRLFPEQFWFDAAVTVGVLSALGALSLIFVTWRAGRSA